MEINENKPKSKVPRQSEDHCPVEKRPQVLRIMLNQDTWCMRERDGASELHFQDSEIMLWFDKEGKFWFIPFITVTTLLIQKSWLLPV